MRGCRTVAKRLFEKGEEKVEKNVRTCGLRQLSPLYCKVEGGGGFHVLMGRLLPCSGRIHTLVTATREPMNRTDKTIQDDNNDNNNK